MSQITESEALRLLHDVNAVITNDHFVYTSGKHGSAYVNKDAVYPHTLTTSLLCLAIAQRCFFKRTEVVIAPAIGGVILSQWTAHHLSELAGRQEEVLGVYAEKSPENDSFVIKRGYNKLVTDKRVLVVEDILNTGGSALKVVEAVRAVGGKVIGVAALCNRGGVTAADIGNPPELFALVNVKMETWDEADCPLCVQGIPINTDVGKGREFLARKKDLSP